ncbi:unnamed protein product [Rotaria sp. Silwood2]|nr:unnamed protein product [Rotaria sp. Silwood2]CAF3017792.1 unnamed protein product [Rotaria sp. Silwood2]CAF4457677.1 unnamed protein product [Rotaria sp. Silwood2]CAF4503703.1 unnamed protein product [Rotaria sp. Silwood2]
MSAQLTSLLGGEWYAVYASITSNLNRIGLFSPIAYFRTLPRQPEPILNLRGKSLSRSTIELVWQPPSKPNGPIINYLVYYAPMEDRLPVNNSKLRCLMKEEAVQLNHINLTQSARCSRPKSRISHSITNNDDDIDDENEENTSIDQVVTDLSILEYQLINSVSQRKDPLFIRQELKETIINDLDHYFEDKSSAFNDNCKSDSQEQPVVEQKPHIDLYIQIVSDTKIIIDDLKEAQMYMFQVYSCHDISKQSLSNACSLNGIILAVRTKLGDPSRNLVRDVQVVDSDQLTTNEKSLTYQISWLESLEPNGLIYFYIIHIGQNSNNGPKEELCVGHDV